MQIILIKHFLIKIVFLVWCMHPAYRGSEKIYNGVIEPFLDKYERKIDSNIAGAEQVAQKAKAAAQGAHVD